MRVAPLLLLVVEGMEAAELRMLVTEQVVTLPVQALREMLRQIYSYVRPAPSR